MAKYTKMDLLKAMEVDDIYPSVIDYHSITIKVMANDKCIVQTNDAEGIINVDDNNFNFNSHEVDINIPLDDIKKFEADWLYEITITI